MHFCHGHLVSGSLCLGDKRARESMWELCKTSYIASIDTFTTYSIIKAHLNSLPAIHQGTTITNISKTKKCCGCRRRGRGVKAHQKKLRNLFVSLQSEMRSKTSTVLWLSTPFIHHICLKSLLFPSHSHFCYHL